MSSSTTKLERPRAVAVKVTGDALIVDLVDGRTITVPVTWYPRLLNASRSERGDWRLIGLGEGIQWPQLDEDISVAGLLNGRASGESQKSLKRWLEQRTSAACSRRRTPSQRAQPCE